VPTITHKPYDRQKEIRAFIDSGDAAIEVEASSEQGLRSSVMKFNEKNNTKIKAVFSRGRFYLVNADKLDT
jgi:hypothetical protein